MKKPRTTTVRKIIETPSVLAIVEVPAILVDEVPNVPLLEAKTVRLLTQARKQAAAGDKEWLRMWGIRIYAELEN